MTRDDVIRMACDAGVWIPMGSEREKCVDTLQRFAALVAAAEREACAAICDTEGREWDSDGVVTEKNYAAYCATAIRSRGNQ